MNRELNRDYWRYVHDDPHIGPCLLVLRELARECERIFELGTERCMSATAFLLGNESKCGLVTSVDHLKWGDVAAIKAAIEHVRSLEPERFVFIEADSRTVEAPHPYDLLFIDTFHNYGQCIVELRRHGPAARRWIALHDTSPKFFGLKGDNDSGGLQQAVTEWLKEHPEWHERAYFDCGSGLTLLERREEVCPPLSSSLSPAET